VIGEHHRRERGRREARQLHDPHSAQHARHAPCDKRRAAAAPAASADTRPRTP
jgi:hypothetical protein